MLTIEQTEQIANIVISIPYSTLITFNEISKKVFGTEKCASQIEKYLPTKLGTKNYPLWRVVNKRVKNFHPIANHSIIHELENEGYNIRYGKFV